MAGDPHPFDPASAEEYLAGREILASAGLLTEPVRFAYYGLEEPAKEEVLGGAPVDRRLRAFLLNLKTGESTDAVISLTEGSVVSARLIDTGAEGQLPIIDSEYHLVEEIVAADPDWQAAMARRGLTDMSKIRICPITAGAFRAPAEDDERRMVRVLAFLQASEHHLAWLRHPRPVGDPLRPRPALSGGRLRQPEPRRGRAARLHRRRPGHRRAGHRGVAYVRADACRPA
jgi:primary-amine oxidase